MVASQDRVWAALEEVFDKNDQAAIDWAMRFDDVQSRDPFELSDAYEALDALSKAVPNEYTTLCIDAHANRVVVATTSVERPTTTSRPITRAEYRQAAHNSLADLEWYGTWSLMAQGEFGTPRNDLEDPVMRSETLQIAIDLCEFTKFDGSIGDLAVTMQGDPAILIALWTVIDDRCPP
ncbi:MAG: hypothetical protein IH941_01535 [Acidobacteria bacterium]|nr:hypothetical protein [Acidobacteriota bacterium]